MENREQLPLRANEERAGAPTARDTANDAAQLRLRQGPLTSAVGWLGTAFNRTQLNKREADERRRRNF